MSDTTRHSQLTYRPIGFLRSPYSRRIDSPHQITVAEQYGMAMFHTGVRLFLH